MNALEFLGVFLVSFGVAVLVKLTHRLHGRWTGDFQESGVQKHHQGNPPRIGLLPLAAGAGAAITLFQESGVPQLGDAARLLAWMLVCAAPAALLGLVEDVTKQVRARWRMLGPIVGVVLAAVFMGALIPATGIPGLDAVITWWPVSLLLTLLLLAGFTHAMNIVDGLNGLASGIALMLLMATAYVSHRVGDTALFQVCVALSVAVLGFMAVNFPRGLMFLGDGGAYFLGFVIALIWVMLLVRNPGEVAPWFTMAIAFHPTMETVYSILRRKLRKRQRNATAPDRLHLHTLIFRRRMRPLLNRFPGAEPWMANAGAAVVVLGFAAAPILAACMNPSSGVWAMTVCVAGVVLYLAQFRALVRFRGALVWGAMGRRGTLSASPHSQFGGISALEGQEVRNK